VRSQTHAIRAARDPDGAEKRMTAQRQPARAEPPSRFDVAAARAMARHSPAEWALLEPTKRTDAIYAELRRVDAQLSRTQGSDSSR